MSRTFTDVTIEELEDRISHYVKGNKEFLAGGQLFAVREDEVVTEVYILRAEDDDLIVTDLFIVWTRHRFVCNYSQTLLAIKDYFQLAKGTLLTIRVKRRLILEGALPMLARFFYKYPDDTDQELNSIVYHPLSIGGYIDSLKGQRVKPAQICCVGYGNLFTKVMNEFDNNTDYKLGLLQFQFLIK